jgi:hypothetical protein
MCSAVLVFALLNSIGYLLSTVENQLNQLYQELRLTSDHKEFNPRVRAALFYIMESQAVESPAPPQTTPEPTVNLETSELGPGEV